MERRRRVKRNDKCPCGSDKKYKHCCWGRVDWNSLFASHGDPIPHLSIRGKNIYFLHALAGILQLDRLPANSGQPGFKGAFTSKAVRDIHELLMDVWPPSLDIASILRQNEDDLSGLYIGDYGPEYLGRGIVRHSIYANKILIVDPFLYPASVRDEYNPILNPDQYRTQTLRNVNLWFSLAPWISAGIVEIIRTPADFDRRLNWESMQRQRRKFETSKELTAAAEASVKELQMRHSDEFAMRHLVLSAPDSYLRRLFEELELGKPGGTVEDFLEYIQWKRDSDPDFLGPLGPGGLPSQLTMMSSGTNYEVAKLTASLTGSYLLTDLAVKWKEIELDRGNLSVENRAWAPLAKAFQNAKIKYLDAVRLDHALTLRKEGRLAALRQFLRKVWKAAATEDGFADLNCELLAEELIEHVNEAEEEWRKVDQDLLKLVGSETVVGLLAAGPLIASGHAAFLAAAVGVAGSSAVAFSVARHRQFPVKYPAAFFLGLLKEAESLRRSGDESLR